MQCHLPCSHSSPPRCTSTCYMQCHLPCSHSSPPRCTSTCYMQCHLPCSHSSPPRCTSTCYMQCHLPCSHSSAPRCTSTCYMQCSHVQPMQFIPPVSSVGPTVFTAEYRGIWVLPRDLSRGIYRGIHLFFSPRNSSFSAEFDV